MSLLFRMVYICVRGICRQIVFFVYVGVFNIVRSNLTIIDVILLFFCGVYERLQRCLGFIWIFFFIFLVFLWVFVLLSCCIWTSRQINILLHFFYSFFFLFVHFLWHSSFIFCFCFFCC